MSEILKTLGLRPGLGERAWLCAVFAAAILAILALGHELRTMLACDPLTPHLLGWAAWFAWQGWLFPRNRARYLKADPVHAYRRAFWWNIVPGVSFGVSQMLRPAFEGFLAGAVLDISATRLLVGLLFLAAGHALLGLGFRTIGFAGAGFLAEYRAVEQPMVKCSVYSYIRHPLFLGGVLASLGSGLLAGGLWPLVLALANVAVLPAYGRIEDARLGGVFGDGYRQYAVSVPRFVPALGVLRAAAGTFVRRSVAWVQGEAPRGDMALTRTAADLVV